MSQRQRRTQKILPEDIFEHAMSFRIAFKHLHYGWKPPHPAAKNAVVTPSAVLSAFTSELLLKTLVLIETSRVPKTHELFTLFNSLSPKTRNRIEALWNSYAKEHEHRWVEFTEMFGAPVARDLPSALRAGSRRSSLPATPTNAGRSFISIWAHSRTCS